MAVSLLTRQVSDLCIGKPALRPISVAVTVAEGLSALKRLGEPYLSVWTVGSSAGDRRCVGKICVADVICFLAREENLKSPAAALQAPISELLSKLSGVVTHLEPNASLLEAIDVILEGAQNLVIPIQTRKNNKNSLRKNQILQKPSLSFTDLQYCWITQEDIVRYLLNSIGLFSSAAATPVTSLNVITGGDSVLSVHHDASALSALTLLSQSVAGQTSVAVIDGEGRLVGEISPATLNSCDETVAAAIATLSAGDLMAYVDCGAPLEDLVQLVKDRLEERNCCGLLEWIEEDYSSSSSSLCSSSSDDEFGSCKSSIVGGRYGGSSGRIGRRSEAIVCHPWSSLMAVMIQALAHRSGYVWVVEEDWTLNGIVTFAGMLKVFRERLNLM